VKKVNKAEVILSILFILVLGAAVVITIATHTERRVSPEVTYTDVMQVDDKMVEVNIVNQSKTSELYFEIKDSWNNLIVDTYKVEPGASVAYCKLVKEIKGKSEACTLSMKRYIDGDEYKWQARVFINRKEDK